eukprot:5762871-Amphidinium_carterae.1
MSRSSLLYCSFSGCRDNSCSFCLDIHINDFSSTYVLMRTIRTCQAAMHEVCKVRNPIRVASLFSEVGSYCQAESPPDCDQV